MYSFCISITSDPLYLSDDENTDNAEEWTEKSGKQIVCIDREVLEMD